MPRLTEIYSSLAISPAALFLEQRYYTLITYQFLHLNFQHILSNMFVLFSVGRAVEPEVGSAKFGASYIVSGVAAGLLHAVLNQGPEALIIGASGSIFGALALLLLLMPFKFTSALVVPLPGVLVGVTMLVVEASSILYHNSAWVAHDVHLYGFLVGGLIAFGIDYDKALKGLIISVIILMALYYWAFYFEGVTI